MLGAARLRLRRTKILWLARSCFRAVDINGGVRGGGFQGIGMVKAFRTTQMLALLLLGKDVPAEYPRTMLLTPQRLRTTQRSTGSRLWYDREIIASDWVVVQETNSMNRKIACSKIPLKFASTRVIYGMGLICTGQSIRFVPIEPTSSEPATRAAKRTSLPPKYPGLAPSSSEHLRQPLWPRASFSARPCPLTDLCAGKAPRGSPSRGTHKVHPSRAYTGRTRGSCQLVLDFAREGSGRHRSSDTAPPSRIPGAEWWQMGPSRRPWWGNSTRTRARPLTPRWGRAGGTATISM